MTTKTYKNINECLKDIMKICSDYACEGVKTNVGGPFGAAVIKEENNTFKIISIARNTVISSKDATCHAEVNAIRKASKILNRFNLSDCILITTAKSCPMCLAAACWAKISTIYYGTDYKEATSSGFADDDIAKYIKGENKELVSEIKFNNIDCLEPFKLWNNKENKTKY